MGDLQGIRRGAEQGSMFSDELYKAVAIYSNISLRFELTEGVFQYHKKIEGLG